MAYTRQPDLKNVSYGPHERYVLDLWQAKSDRPTPIVVYFHPGGFSHGDKIWIEWLDKPKVGVECPFRTSKDYPAGEVNPFTAEMVDFFIKHFP